MSIADGFWLGLGKALAGLAIVAAIGLGAAAGLIGWYYIGRLARWLRRKPRGMRS